MVNRRLVLVIAAVGAALSVVGGTAVSTRAADGVASVDAAWTKAVTTGNLDAVVACYAPDAVAWLPQQPEAKGREAIRASYQQLFAANTIKDVVFSQTHYHTMGDRSIGWGRVSLTFVPKAGGAATVVISRFTEVAERRGNGWVYLADHASDDPVTTRTGAK